MHAMLSDVPFKFEYTVDQWYLATGQFVLGMMMEAIWTSETLVNLHHLYSATTQKTAIFKASRLVLLIYVFSFSGLRQGTGN
jgi:hypothetical protein